jgi:hypothetical protein
MYTTFEGMGKGVYGMGVGSQTSTFVADALLWYSSRWFSVQDEVFSSTSFSSERAKSPGIEL